jgi:hypothetical protein
MFEQQTLSYRFVRFKIPWRVKSPVDDEVRFRRRDFLHSEREECEVEESSAENIFKDTFRVGPTVHGQMYLTFTFRKEFAIKSL